MKKVILVGALVVFALSSCKKDYTCECTILGQTTSSPIPDSSKKDANDACDALGTSAALLGGSCTLK